MAGETSSGSGAADRSNNSETGRTDDPWRRIEAERPQREAARKAWDETHDPSPEFEYAIRPLGNDYGRDRPKHRELTEEQRAELAEVFGRPADELLALRDKDPRAGHNRDDQGRILGPDGTPRPERTPEQILREAQRQADLYGPNAKGGTEAAEATEADVPAEADHLPAEKSDDEPRTPDSPDLQAPSDRPEETTRTEPGEALANDTATDDGNDGNGDAGRGGSDGDNRTDEPSEPDESGEPGDSGEPNNSDEPEPNRPQDLGGVVGEIAAKLRTGEITPRQAADQLEHFRDNTPSPETEPTTETVRTEQTTDGERHYQRGTPTETANTTGERITNEQSDKVSRAQRLSAEYKRASEAVPDFEKVAEKVNALVDSRLPPGTHGESTVRQPDIPTIETRHTGEVDPGNIVAASLAFTIAIVVSGQRMHDKIRTRNNQQRE